MSEGPELRRGLEFLTINRIPYFYGRYRRADDTERFEVFYTGTPLVLPADRLSLKCGSLPFIRLPEHPHVLLYQHTGEEGTALWSVFVKYQPQAADECVFAGTFIRRFLFFLSSSRGEPLLPPFPAVLQLNVD